MTRAYDRRREAKISPCAKPGILHGMPRLSSPPRICALFADPGQRPDTQTSSHGNALHQGSPFLLQQGELTSTIGRACRAWQHRS
jgi:hypothetical protein